MEDVALNWAESLVWKPLQEAGPFGEEPDKENGPLLMLDAGLRANSRVGFPSYPVHGSTRIFCETASRVLAIQNLLSLSEYHLKVSTVDATESGLIDADAAQPWMPLNHEAF